MPGPSFLGRACLPPSLRLQAVGEPAGTVLKGDPAYETPEAVRPTPIRKKRSQYGTAEELAASTDLRRDSELAEPPIELPVPGLRSDKTLRVIEPTLKRQGKILGEEHFRPHTD